MEKCFVSVFSGRHEQFRRIPLVLPAAQSPHPNLHRELVRRPVRSDAGQFRPHHHLPDDASGRERGGDALHRIDRDLQYAGDDPPDRTGGPIRTSAGDPPLLDQGLSVIESDDLVSYDRDGIRSVEQVFVIVIIDDVSEVVDSEFAYVRLLEG